MIVVRHWRKGLAVGMVAMGTLMVGNMTEWVWYYLLTGAVLGVVAFMSVYGLVAPSQRKKVRT